MEKAFFEIVEFDVEDIITTSGYFEDGGSSNPSEGENGENIGEWNNTDIYGENQNLENQTSVSATESGDEVNDTDIYG